MKRDTKELYLIIDQRLEGKQAKDFTIERLVPDEKDLEGFTDLQLIRVSAEKGLRIPYCCWCEDMIKPNGKWTEMPDEYRAMLFTNKRLMRNQGICPVCEYDEAKEYLDSLSKK